MRAEDAPPLHRESPYLAIAAAVLAWGVGPLFVRAVDASGVTISFWRLWLAVPFTLLLARLAGAPLTWRIMKLSALPGALFGLSILFGFTSFQKTSLANATLIAALQPLLVLLVAGRLFGERVGRPEVLLAATSLAGIAMVVVGAGGTGGATPGGRPPGGGQPVRVHRLLPRHQAPPRGRRPGRGAPGRRAAGGSPSR